MKASLERWPLGAPHTRAAALANPPMVESLSEIYAAHFDFVWRNARRLGVAEADADDVVQDVFVIVQRRIASFDGRTHMRAWIFGILARVVHDHRRSFQRKGARCISIDDEASKSANAVAQGPTPVELAERAERVRLLDTLLNELDEDKRMLLVLSELEQWTLREIAELMGSNTNTIHSRLCAAKRAFEGAYARRAAATGGRP